MRELISTTLMVNGVKTQVLRGGDGQRSILLLHGGSPGITPFLGSSQLWEPVLKRFAENARVVAIDLLGSGGTDYPLDRPLTVFDLGRHVAATIEALDLPPSHVLGHDLGGLIALWLGMQGSARIMSVGVIASSFATPVSEAWDDVTLAAPPHPLLGRDSQRWAFERLSATVAHVDDALLDSAVELGLRDNVQRAVKRMASETARAAFHASHGEMRGEMWSMIRNSGYPLPVQLIWGAEDPLVGIDAGHILFQAIGTTQRMVQFHVINEAGSFPFREQPATFRRIVNGFLDGLDQVRFNAAIAC